MNKMRNLVVAVVALLGFLGAAQNSMAGAINFGITADRTKVGEGRIYGPGPQMAIDGDTIYVTHTASNIFGEKEVRIAKSIDGGSEWEGSVVIAHDAKIDMWGPSIAIGPDGVGGKIIHVIWGQIDALTGIDSIFYSNSHDDGVSWSVPQLVTGSSGGGGEYMSIAADNIGGVHVAYPGYCSSTRAWGVAYSKSSDYGASFAEIGTPVYCNGAQGTSMAVTASGDVFLSWYAGGRSAVFFSKRLAGGSFQPAIQIPNTMGLGGDYPSIAVYDTSNIYIAWSTPTGVFVSSSSNGGTSWTKHTVTTAAAGVTIAYSSMALYGSSTLNVAWTSSPSSGGDTRIDFARSTNKGSSWTNPAPVVAANVYYPEMEIAVNGNGKVYTIFTGNRIGPWVAYFTSEY